MLIYKITNIINNKKYIGLTTTKLEKRVSAYKTETKLKRHHNTLIIKAMIKYGIDNFKFEVIEDNIEDETYLKKCEIFYIKEYKTTDSNIGYNISPGGDLRSKETIEKSTVSRKWYKPSDSTKTKISNSLKGKLHSVERKLKQSKALRKLYKNGYISHSKGRKALKNSGSFVKGKASVSKGRVQIIDYFGKIHYIDPKNITKLP